MTATTELLDLVRRWAAAEQDNDPGRLDGVPAHRWLLANVHIGPLQPAGPRSA